MSSQTGASTSGRPALSRLIDCSPDQFGRLHWDRAPLLSHRPSFADLFSQAAADELLSTRGLRAPFIRLARDGATLPDRSFTAAGGVGAAIADQVSEDKILTLFADGATVVLQGLHRTWEPLASFGRQLHDDLGHPVQINAYLTPPQNQGFADHYDVHDVFVLQIAGRKQWRVREPVLAKPLRSQPWSERAEQVRHAAEQPPLLEQVLEPGDCLYLPRGYLHSATALGEISIHLTIGVHVRTVRQLADAVLTRLAAGLDADASLRSALPVGVSPDSKDVALEAKRVRDALLDALAELDVAAAATEAISQEAPGTRAEPLSPLAQAQLAAGLTGDTRLRLRAGLAARLTPTENEDHPVRLTSRAGALSLDEAGARQVEQLLARPDQVVTAAGLGIELARALLRHGILVPAASVPESSVPDPARATSPPSG